MAELILRPPFEGLLPVLAGPLRLEAAALGPLHQIAAFPGSQDALRGALTAAGAPDWPAPGRCTAAGGARLMWFGRNEALLIGAPPPEGLGAHAGVFDVTDGWAAAYLSGPGAEDALARLVAADLRPASCPPGTALRSPLGHMPGALLRQEDRWLILTFRSMAATLAEELGEAMQAVAARAAM